MPDDSKQQDEFEVPEFHRDEALDEEGVSMAVVEQFVNHRLPFLIRVKDEMDQGKVLTEGELQLMTRTVERLQNVKTLVYQHPELKELVAKMIDLLHDITGEAVDNETTD